MVNLSLKPVWLAGDQNPRQLDEKLIELLHEVTRCGSLYQAARRAGVSYRHAWGMIARWSEFFGQPLLKLERGRGAKLAAFGEKLLSADERVKARLAPQLESLASELNRELNQAPGFKPAIRIHASHDFALAQLRELAAASLNVDLQFRGSLDSLESLARSQCDLAGFHIAENKLGATLAAPYRKWLKPRLYKLIRLASRKQGLMLARGNPRRIRKLSDLTRSKIRFVNRQQGSGTRLLFDRLLANTGIEAKRISGYQTEEFTHAAVAATVASGMADAGFGIEAAARQFALDFLPFTTERYFLAGRNSMLAQPALKLLLELLKSKEFKDLAASLPGYDASEAGRILSVAEAFRN